jgi:hypothetical protein
MLNYKNISNKNALLLPSPNRALLETCLEKKFDKYGDAGSIGAVAVMVLKLIKPKKKGQKVEFC